MKKLTKNLLLNFIFFSPQDFSNLMSVYLDAVFCPLLRELDFLQEGWRLENEELDDKNSPFIIKGKWTMGTTSIFAGCSQK